MAKIKRQEAAKIGLEITAYAGDAKSFILEAFTLVHQGKKDEARAKIAEAETSLKKAHEAQQQIIKQEVAGAAVEYSFVLTHGQDHLMTTCALRDLYLSIMRASEKSS